VLLYTSLQTSTVQHFTINIKCHMMLCSTTHLINQAADLLDGLAKNELCILQPFEIRTLEKIPRAINHSNLNK